MYSSDCVYSKWARSVGRWTSTSNQTESQVRTRFEGSRWDMQWWFSHQGGSQLTVRSNTLEPDSLEWSEISRLDTSAVCPANVRDELNILSYVLNWTHLTDTSLSGYLSGGASPGRRADQDSSRSSQPSSSPVPRTEESRRILQLSAEDQWAEKDRALRQEGWVF